MPSVYFGKQPRLELDKNPVKIHGKMVNVGKLNVGEYTYHTWIVWEWIIFFFCSFDFGCHRKFVRFFQPG